MILETAAVFLGLYVAGIYHGQLGVMQGQLGEIIKQYPELQKSADAAKAAAGLAELSERPWVKIVDVKTSRNRNGAQPFLLSCPVVRRQLPRLIRRHLGFLAALFIAQTTALNLRPNLPAHWVTPSSRDASSFALILGVLCLCLAIVQTLTNRSLLERAHLSAQTEAGL